MQAVDGKGRGVYHVSSGSDYAIKELFDEAVAALRINLAEPVEVRPRHPDDTYTILLDPSHTKHDFGWQVRTPLKEGVQRAIDWYKQHDITQTFTHLSYLKH